MVCFQTPISLFPLEVLNQPTLHEKFEMHAHIVVNAVGSAIDMYSIPSLKNFSGVSVLD